MFTMYTVTLAIYVGKSRAYSSQHIQYTYKMCVTYRLAHLVCNNFIETISDIMKLISVQHDF